MDYSDATQNIRERMTATTSRLLNHLRTPLYRNGYALALSAGMTSVLGLLFWVLVARFYPAETVGLNSAVLSAMMLLSGVAQLSLNSVLVRFIPVAGKSTRRLILSAYATSLMASAVIALIFGLGTPIWAPSMRFLADQPLFLLGFVLSSMVWSIFSLQDSVMTGLRQALWVPLENSIFATAKIALVIWFASLIPRFGIFIAWVLPIAGLIIPINALIFKRLLPAHAEASRDEEEHAPIRFGWIAKYTSGNYVGTLFTLLSTMLLPILVNERLGSSQNAYFYLPWTITTSLQLLGQNMTTSLTVEAAREQEKSGEYGYRILIHTLRLLAPVVAILFIGAPLFLRVFGSKYSTEGGELLRLLSLAVIPNLVIVLYIALARVKNQIKGIIAVQGVLSFLVLGSSILLMDLYGITGVGWGWLGSQSIVAAVLVIAILRPLLRRRG